MHQFPEHHGELRETPPEGIGSSMRPFAAGCRDVPRKSSPGNSLTNGTRKTARERCEAPLEEDLNHPIEEVGARLRSRMAWLA